MTIVDTLETVRQWLEDNVCPLVKLKLPDDSHTDGSYEYKLVNPQAFSLFIPTTDRLPPKVAAPIPSVCVSLVQGTDKPLESAREVKIRLDFSAWDPGHHAPDLFYAKDGGGLFIKDNDEVLKQFQKNDLGWRDVWNFTDTALREIENAEYLNGIRVKKELGLDFGIYSEEKATPNFWPFWFSWIEFAVEIASVRKIPKSYENLL